MKRVMSKKLRAALALVMVASMLFGLFGTALAVTVSDHDNDGVIRYVSLGASNTNGYGIHGYLPEDVSVDPLSADQTALDVHGYLHESEAAYPAQVADAIAFASGKEVELTQLAIRFMRAEEVRMLLDDTYYGDDYTAWRFYDENGNGWFAQVEGKGANSCEEALGNLRGAYKGAIAEADVISVDVGQNNFGTYTVRNIQNILSSGAYWKAPDFSQIMESGMQEKYHEFKGMAMAMLCANMGLDDPEMEEKLEMIAEVLTYAALGYIQNFDIVMEKIFELNPDATVVVVGIQNALHDLDVVYDGAKLHLGDLYGQLIDMTNMYTASASPRSADYLYAKGSENGHAHSFLDEILAWNGDPTTLSDSMKECFDVYDEDLRVRSLVEYILVAPALGVQMPVPPANN